MIEIEDSIKRWEDKPCSWVVEFCYNGQITQGSPQIQGNPYQNTKGTFHITRTNNLKTYTETRKTRKGKTVLRNEEALLISKSVWYWPKNRHTGEWNRRESENVHTLTVD